MSDLIERLRIRERAFAGTYEGPEIFKEAADRIEQLEAEIDLLRRSLDNIKIRAYELGQKEIHDMALAALGEDDV